MGKFAVRTEDVIWRKIGDEIVVIKDDGQSVHVLNKTAAHIWEMCDGEYSPDAIATSLCERFDVTLDEAIEDVRDMVMKFGELGILKQTGEVAKS